MKVCILNIIKRNGSGKAILTVIKLEEHSLALQLDIIYSANIDVNGLNPGGLLLSGKSLGRLAVDFIQNIIKKSFIRCYVWWQGEDSFQIISVPIILIIHLENKKIKILIKPFLKE